MRSTIYYIAALSALVISCGQETNTVDVIGDTLAVVRDSTRLRIREHLIDRARSTESEAKAIVNLYGREIKKYAKQYGFDWRLILAVIKQESKFSEAVASHQGAFGLMQLMPRTGDELADRLGLEEVISPRNNIAAGVFYLWQQYDSFGDAKEDDRIRLTLAAYNCGLGHVLDAQKIAEYSSEDVTNWTAVASALHLLSKQYYTLHQHIWDEERPANGYFLGWKQTTEYVSNVMGYYEEYKTLLP